MRTDLLTAASSLIALAALFVSFLAFRRAGHRRAADFHQDWLRELRTKVAELLAILALTEADVRSVALQPRQIDQNKLTFIVEYVCLLLDERVEEQFKDLRGAIVRLALLSGIPNQETAEAMDEVTTKTKTILRSEAQRIERELKRII